MTHASALRALLGVTPLDSDKFAAQLNQGIAGINQNKVDGVYNATTAAFALSGDSNHLYKALGEIRSMALCYAPAHLPEMVDAVQDFSGDEQLADAAEHFVTLHNMGLDEKTTTYASKELGLGYDLDVHDNTHNSPEEGHPSIQRGILNIKKLEKALWDARSHPTQPATSVDLKAAAPKFWKPRNSLHEVFASL